MTFWAWVVFLLAIAYTIGDGLRRTAGAKTMEGFFAAGRSIPWWAAGLSVMATQLSAITLIGGIGMGYENGLEWVQFYFALPFAMVVLCIWFVPMYRAHPILTAYQYLERRFGPVTRSLTSLAFLLSRCLAFAVVLYAPAVVFAAMTGLPIAVTVWVTGLLTTAYTVIGGVGGVVWTDVKQMIIIALGILACFLVLLWQVVGELSFAGVLTVLGAAGKLNPVEVYDPTWTAVPALASAPENGSFWADKYNIWTGLFGTLFLFLSYFGCDQSQVQSILTSKSVDASRRALLMSAFTKIPLQLLVLLIGGLLFLHQSLGREPVLFSPDDQALAAGLTGASRADYEQAALDHEEASAARQQAMQALANGSAQTDATALTAQYRNAVQAAVSARSAARKAAYAPQIAKAKASGTTFAAPSDANYIFPDFIFRELPKPVLGLLIAAIFAAAISSAAGALSSLTAATMVDFYKRWLRPQASDAATLRASRVAMAGWGVAATAAAVSLGGGPLLERVNEVGSWFYGSILGVFVLALAMPRANGKAASAGLVSGLLFVFLLNNTVQIAYLWFNLIGCVICVGVGAIVTLVTPHRAAAARI
jgi:Na+/proline symporter